MKSLIYASAFTIIGSCASLSHKEKVQALKDTIVIENPKTIESYANTITSKELKTHLYAFASKEFQGRKVGTPGQKLAAQYLKDYYVNESIASPFDSLNYFQSIPESYLLDGYNASENVLAYIKGEAQPEEIIIVSAHFDHEGTSEDGEIFYGADDDGSGTVALLEIAQAFKQAKINGHGPKRSILFLHLTAEEIGLHGSKFYTENPVFPLDKTVANLNIDMIGRVNKIHEDNENYIYIIGADRLSKELHYVMKK